MTLTEFCVPLKNSGAAAAAAPQTTDAIITLKCSRQLPLAILRPEAVLALICFAKRTPQEQNAEESTGT